jgi:two-component system CheB/CheR fusion protein
VGDDGEVKANRSGATLLGEGIERRQSAGLRPLAGPVRLFAGERELRPEEQPLEMASRTAKSQPNFEGRLLRADGELVDVMINTAPLVAEDGKAHGGIAAIVDMSERKRAEERRQVLVYELQHRVKNIIATISALATRTVHAGMALEQFSEAFLGRLRGMAATHELLSRGNWQGAGLAELIEVALHAHASTEGGVSIKGPQVVMLPNAAATLGMVFYELATNAAKYGALSQRGGKIDVTWKVEDASPARRVALLWAESGGKSSDGAAAGFGTTFIKRSIEYELQGAAEMQPTAHGVRWKIEFPYEPNVQRS